VPAAGFSQSFEVCGDKEYSFRNTNREDRQIYIFRTKIK